MTVPKLGTIVLILSTVVLTSATAYGVWWYTRPPVDTTVATIAPVAPAIKRVKKRIVPVKQAVVYAPEAKAKLKLPTDVIANNQQQVTGSTTVAPSERRVTVTSVLNTETGETTTYTKPEPLPWIAVESRGEARFDYGYKMQRGHLQPMPTGRLSIVQDFVQVKGFHAGIQAALDTDGTFFAGIGVGYRW